MVRIDRAVAAAGVGDAGARRRAVDLDGAGAAHAVLAADMRAGQQQVAAQQIGELLARLGQHLLAASPLTVSEIAILLMPRRLLDGAAQRRRRRWRGARP